MNGYGLAIAPALVKTTAAVLELSGVGRRVEGGKRGRSPRNQDSRLDSVGGGGDGTRPVISPLTRSSLCLYHFKAGPKQQDWRTAQAG
jgi:hypothetical protein